MTRRILLVVLLAACADPPAPESTATAGDYAVDKLFVHDGCAVYRFRDKGEPRYFVKCDRGSDTTETDNPATTTTRTGKTSTTTVHHHPQSVPTAYETKR